MKPILKEISRRNLFRYLGNSAVALPFMRTLLETQAFGEVVRKRAVIYYYPNGNIPEEFFPRNLGSDFTLPRISEPLQGIRDDIILMKNLDFVGSTHEENMNYAMTGMERFKAGISIDTVLGDMLKEGVSLPVLRLGVFSQIQGQPNYRTASFFAPGQPSQIEDNPTRAFQNLFGDSTSQAIGLSTSMRKSVLDASLGDLRNLQSTMGSIEKVKLDLHVESVREIERRLQTGAAGDGMASQCSKKLKNPTVFEDKGERTSPWYRPENFATVVDLNTEIALQALACGATNVVYIQNSHSVGSMPFANGAPSARGDDHHHTSHYNEFKTRDDHIANQRYFMTKFAELITGMKAIKEGDKTLLYNSCVMAWTELGDSQAHNVRDMASILAGQAGGYFKTGRIVDVARAKQNRVLVSMLRAFGSNAEVFGNPSFGSGILTNLQG